MSWSVTILSIIITGGIFFHHCCDSDCNNDHEYNIKSLLGRQIYTKFPILHPYWSWTLLTAMSSTKKFVNHKYIHLVAHGIVIRQRTMILERQDRRALLLDTVTRNLTIESHVREAFYPWGLVKLEKFNACNQGVRCPTIPGYRYILKFTLSPFPVQPMVSC